MPYGYLYGIFFPNEKVYIGLTTTSLEQRKEGHKKCVKNNDPRLLYKALRKYNMVDTFELIEIDDADTKEELCEKEIGYIRMYRSSEKEYGYNMTCGGEGVIGYVYTEEDKKKMSEAIKKAYEKTGAREKRSEIMKKRFEKPGAREKQSETIKQYFIDNPEAVRKLSEATKAHFAKPGAREKQSETIKQYFIDNPEAVRKLSEATKAQFAKPGAREKHSETIKKAYEKPGAREKLSEKRKTFYKENPDAGIKYGEKMKKYFEKSGAKQHLLDAKGKNKPFDVFTKDGTFVKTFTYQMDAREYLQKEYGITSTIKSGEVLKGRRKSSAGFVFKYQ